MTTIINSNGRGAAEDIGALFARLDSDILDRTFEAYGNFVTEENGAALFFGNFLTYSHVFNVSTDDADLIERLTTAIHANQEKPEYRRQPPPFDRDKLVINRKRFSTTQGEVELLYDGRRLEQFGDEIQMNGRGDYRGRNDRYWEDVARAWLASEHVAAFDKAETLATEAAL